MSSTLITQRADLTFKHDAAKSRHGWLRLTPAYSVKLVQQLLEGRDPSQNVFDPFSGTATTPLAATMMGHQSCSCDINPFLIWLGNVKLSRYTKKDVRELLDAAQRIEDDVAYVKAAAPPPIAFIERWWDEENLHYLCCIKAGIEKYSSPNTRVKNLLLVSFCRLVMELSNAAFNHQSVSFKKTDDSPQMVLWSKENHAGAYFNEVDYISKTVLDNPPEHGYVIQSDARELRFTPDFPLDIVITSPPYPNRMSYIRELRPYMYWLGYLNAAPEAGELDWQAIGGTWGSATSRLKDWEPDDKSYQTKMLLDSLDGITRADNKSGILLANYVNRYFYDMWRHFKSMYRISPNAELHYIIGNSKFYDQIVPAEVFYAEMLENAGFKKVSISVIRKRNSKKELYEYDVSANI